MNFKIDTPTSRLIALALEEDIGPGWPGDVTTRYFLPQGKRFRAQLVFKEDGIQCVV